MTMRNHVVRYLAAAAVLAATVGVGGFAPVTASASAADAAEDKTLSGEAARTSDPGKAVVALIEAARKGDRAAVRNLLLPEVVKDLESEPDMVMEILATMADEKISEITIKLVDADRAEGRVTKREGAVTASTGMTIKRVGGTWKISL